MAHAGNASGHVCPTYFRAPPAGESDAAADLRAGWNCGQRRCDVSTLPARLHTIVQRRTTRRVCAPAEAMIKSQIPLEGKIKQADHVVWNNGDRAVLAAQAASLVELWRQEKWTKA